MQQYSVSGIARLIGAKPRDVSDLFYRRVLRDDICPLVAGRRIVPESYADTIRAALRRAGKKLDQPKAAKEVVNV